MQPKKKTTTDRDMNTDQTNASTKDQKNDKTTPVNEKKILDLEAKIKELAAIIDEVEDEKLEINNKMMKALADYQNLEKSINTRVESRMTQQKVSVASALMEIIDDLKFGNEAAKSLKVDGEVKSWVDGMLGTMEKMEKAVGELGIVLMDVKVGDEFDSSIHEAIGLTNEGKDNTVAHLVQPGYLMGEMVVRPARVIVNKKD